MRLAERFVLTRAAMGSGGDRSSAPARLAENLAVLDFDLDADDRRAFAALDDPLGRRGPDPIVFG